MINERVLKYVQLATNIAIVCVCVLLVWNLVTRKQHNIRGLGRGNSGTGAALENIALPSLPNYKWESHTGTLVLAIRKGCSFCKARFPFYRRLSELEKSANLRAHVLAVMPDNQEVGATELQSNGIVVEGIFSEPLNKINITGTPTIMLVDVHGHVARAWVGQLSPREELDVIKAASSARF